MRGISLAGLVLGILACGGATEKPSTAPSSGSGSEATRNAPAQSVSVDEAECDRLFEHVIELAAAELNRSLREEHAKKQQEAREAAVARGEPAPESRPIDPSALVTPDDMAKISPDYRTQHLKECLSLSREQYECAMTADSVSQLAGC